MRSLGVELENWKVKKSYKHVTNIDMTELYNYYGNMKKMDFHRVGSSKSLMRRYLEEHPEYETCRFVFLNCMDLDDPGHDARLRDHTGYHPATMMHVAMNLPEEQLKNLAKGCYHWAECRRTGDHRNLVVVPICRRERHRSVAARELIRAYLDQQNVSNAEIKDGPLIKFPRHFCENRRLSATHASTTVLHTYKRGNQR